MTDSWQRTPLSRRTLLAGAGAFGLGGLLAACGGSDGGSSPGTGGDHRDRRHAGIGRTGQGGTLRFGYNQATATDTLDLPTAVNDWMQATGRQMNAGIGKTSYDGSFKNILAEEISYDSPTQITVRLKQGLEFHNGKTITANDVLASYRRMADPNEVTSPGPFLADIDMTRKQRHGRPDGQVRR